MATWITHMRIAEYFMNIDNQLNCIDFLIGNIAPDCGIPNEDGNGFIPDKGITHWKLDKGDDGSEDFKKRYVKRENEHFNFYLGYYFHLLTDIAWKHFPLQGVEIVDGRLKLDKNLNWETVKKDWYGQDHLYLQNNPDFVFFKMFQHIEDYPNKFFDFYPPEAFTWQIKYITNFYLNAKEDAEREFPHLSKLEMDSFVNKTVYFLKEVYHVL